MTYFGRSNRGLLLLGAMVFATHTTQGQGSSTAATQFLTIPTERIGTCQPVNLAKVITESPRARKWTAVRVDIGTGIGPTRSLTVTRDSAGRVVQFAELLDYMTVLAEWLKHRCNGS